MEYLDAGGIATQQQPPVVATARPPRRWLPILLGLATFLIVLVGLGAVVGDWTARNLEMRSLVTQVEASEAAMGTFQDSVMAIANEYQGRGQLSDADQAQLDAALKQAATEGRDAIAAAGDKVAGVRWLLWHRDVGAAQKAYLAHNRAWQDYLNKAAQDPAEFGKKQDAINSTFAEAEIDVRAAVPVPPLFHLRDRVDVIFAPPPVPEGAGQQA